MSISCSPEKTVETCKVSFDQGETWESSGMGSGSTFFELFNYNEKIFALSSKGGVYNYWLDNVYPAKALFEQMADNSETSSTVVSLSNLSENATTSFLGLWRRNNKYYR